MSKAQENTSKKYVVICPIRSDYLSTVCPHCGKATGEEKISISFGKSKGWDYTKEGIVDKREISTLNLPVCDTLINCRDRLETAKAGGWLGAIPGFIVGLAAFLSLEWDTAAQGILTSIFVGAIVIAIFFPIFQKLSISREKKQVMKITDNVDDGVKLAFAGEVEYTLASRERFPGISSGLIYLVFTREDAATLFADMNLGQVYPPKSKLPIFYVKDTFSTHPVSITLND